MFTSFIEKDFWKAIEKKDYSCLKICAVCSMLQDPTFERGETERVLAILKEKVPEIFEEEVELDYEERSERSAWNKRYFTGLVWYFQENFAESRIEYIKEVGKVVHKDTAEAYRKSMKEPVRLPKQSHSKNSQNVPRKPNTEKHQNHRDKVTNFPPAGTIIAVVVLAGIVVLLIKLL